jgi:murein DD-endopeptidase MepM/ murein hydrolase activator NlpD
MRNFRTLSRFALIGVVGGLSGACSETARLNPFPDLFGSSARTSSEPPMTGSVSRDNSGSVQSRPLAPPAAVSQPAAAPAYNRPAAAAPAPKAVPAAPPPVATGPGGWTAQGGTAVSVKPGESLNTLASRYNVPPAAILSANNLKNAAQVAPGKRIVIPVYSVGAAAPARPAAAKAAEPKPQLVQGPKGQAKPAEPQKQAAKPEPQKQAAKPEPQKQAAKPEPQKQAAKPEPQKQVAQKAAPQATQPKETAKAETQVPKAEVAQTGSIAPQAAAPAPAPAIGFRWPAKGRVIAGFGGTSANEGINIALPEGTPVKAAEDGTVAYAGSDVKGYGKLVLIRHDNGYVSAYAHNGEIAVKHGEKVKRGQAIAKSGQSGNVTSPQLHFEIRKGAQPVDPMPHLQGG